MGMIEAEQGDGDVPIYTDGHRTVERCSVAGAGGAFVRYRVMRGRNGLVMETIGFQSDTIEEIGVEDWTNECLLAVVIDRLQSFQAGDFPSPFNARALDHVKEALGFLEERTADRVKRGVEGKHEA